MPTTPPRSAQRHRALLALVLVAPAPSIGAALAFHVAPGEAGNLAYLLCKGILYGAPLLWLLFVDRRPLSFSRPRKGGLLVGALLGLLIGAAVLAVYAFLIRGRVDTAALLAIAAQSGFDTPGRYVAVCLYLCVVNALLEEYAFRWFLYTRCRSLLGMRSAAVLAALVFTAHHVVVLRAFFNWPLTLLAALGVFLGGLIWTLCYERYASIWPGYISHALTDIAVLGIGWSLLF